MVFCGSRTHGLDGFAVHGFQAVPENHGPRGRQARQGRLGRVRRPFFLRLGPAGLCAWGLHVGFAGGRRRVKRQRAVAADGMRSPIHPSARGPR